MALRPMAREAAGVQALENHVRQHRDVHARVAGLAFGRIVGSENFSLFLFIQ